MTTTRTLLKFTPDLNADMGEKISKIVSEYHYVKEDITVGDIAHALHELPELKAIAIVDKKDQVIGFIESQHLFNQLARPYGLDLLKRKAVSELMEEIEEFHCDRNILSVAEQIGTATREKETKYYILMDNRRQFRGIFSTLDMLIYLSDRTRQDILMARSLQKRIIPESQSYQSEDFSYLVSSIVAKGVGGDFQFSKEYSQYRRFTAICDVSGKGVAASLITSAMWGFFEMYDFKRGMKSFLQQLNSHLYKTFHGVNFVTGLFLDVHQDTGKIFGCDLGHGHMYIFRGGKLKGINFPQANLPLGVMNEIESQMHRIHLNEGDLAVCVTDGLLEQKSDSGEEFAEAHLAHSLRRRNFKNLRDLQQSIFEDFHNFRGMQPLQDDVSLQLISYKGLEA
jgi:sigma-B regulation protein RsbU (phosphoserine phosphatase)